MLTNCLKRSIGRLITTEKDEGTIKIADYPSQMRNFREDEMHYDNGIRKSDKLEKENIERKRGRVEFRERDQKPENK